MAVVFEKLEMPENISVEETSNNFARFVAEPFGRGYGHTLGNSLRRMLLTSIESPAIVSLAIEGVPHEYMAVEGIIEDVVNIVLNFKCALLRRLPHEDQPDSRCPTKISSTIEITEEDLKKTGQVEVKLKDVVKSELFEVVNPDLHLFTVTKPMKKKVDLLVAIGKGYVPSERHEVEEKSINEIVIDTSFSPVLRVNYWVENTRVGQDTDYDKLILEITTDGRITPKEALAFTAQIAINHYNVFQKLESYELTFQEQKVEKDTDKDEMVRKLCLRINEIELSVRSTNCLSSAQIHTIGELVVKPESEMLKYRNFGKKSLNEIKDKLHDMNLSLGMDLTKYGINRDNIKDIIDSYNDKEVE